MYSVIESIVIGLIQGILEWLPVSSEGNMIIVLAIIFDLPVEETISTAIFLHIGTSFAALVYFRDEALKILIRNTPEYADIRLKLLVITILTGVVGFPIYLWINVSVTIGETLIALTGIALIITGLLQRQASKQPIKRSNLNWPTSIILGVSQGLAIIPGLSRSGLTTSIMLIKGFTSEEAFRVSFLMSIPASFAAALGMMFVDGFSPNPFAALSALIAAGVGYLMIDSLLGVARKFSFWKICLGLGALAVIAWLPNLVP